MAVQFREGLPSNSPALIRKLRTARGPAASVVRAVLVKGLAAGEAPEEIRSLIKQHGRGVPRGASADLGAEQQVSVGESSRSAQSVHRRGGAATPAGLVRYDRVWRDFLEAAEREVLSSPSVSGDFRGAHVSAAKKLYAGLLHPLPYPAKVDFRRNVGARAAFAWVGLQLLDDELARSTVVVSKAKLAATMGWTPKSAARYVGLLTEQHLLQEANRAESGAGRFELSRVTLERREILPPFVESIGLLVDGYPDPLGEVIRSVAHPAWAHSSRLDHRHWLMLLCDVAGIPVSELGMSGKTEREVRPMLEQESLSPATVSPFLSEILDRIAANPEHGKLDEDSGMQKPASEIAKQAMANWERASKAFRDDQDAWKAAKEKARAVDAGNVSEQEPETESWAPDEPEAEIRAAADPVNIPSPPTESAHSGINPQVIQFIDALLKRYPMPQAAGADSDEGERKQFSKMFPHWTTAVREPIAERGPTEQFMAEGAAVLQERLRDKGYTPNAARRAAHFIMRGEWLDAAG
ncbi:hypothetical protein [Paramicrobacterium fandaimingii]|uniref:hypothetical protein n=1 Tax=Paramicrobacterium fandaimingii TaxID=2708079 RepID=UPI00142258B6|nr:hypothetical protein [Microbacterium fandaimingii]